MKKLKAGIVGLGLIGSAHADAIRRVGFAELVAASDISVNRAAELNIDKFYADYRELLADPEIDVVHNCTPNNVHFEINRRAAEAGKHIFSEKPLALNSDESYALLEVIKKHPVHNAVNFNYRMFPNVQRMKEIVVKGEAGRPLIVHGKYMQDWLLYDTDYNWRVDPEYGGLTRAVADIGSHWCDLAQTVTGSKITELFADLATFYPVRRVLTPSGSYEEKVITTEDYASVLLRFDNGAHGVFCVSQMSAGRKNYLEIEVNGSESSVAWNQEDCDKLWLGSRDGDNAYALRRWVGLAALPDGHPEGWADALKNNVKTFYEDIRDDKTGGGYATFEDGHVVMAIIDAILESSRTKSWATVRSNPRGA